jgi:putative Mg2+ transporter-C (MgtC) family protein
METTITEIEIIIRLCLGLVAGAIIGFERSSRRQVAGLRTHVLICVGATLLMLLSIWVPQQFYAMKNGDPGRIAAQVVSGIGFLGAGAIIRLGHNVKGLTTAASLWIVAAVGLAIGAGMYIAAASAELIALITLILLYYLEKRIFPTARNKLLELRYKHGAVPDTRTSNDILSNFGIQTLSMDVDQDVGKARITRIRYYVSIPDTADLSRLAKALKTSGDVTKVEIKEKY